MGSHKAPSPSGKSTTAPRGKGTLLFQELLFSAQCGSRKKAWTHLLGKAQTPSSIEVFKSDSWSLPPPSSQPQSNAFLKVSKHTLEPIWSRRSTEIISASYNQSSSSRQSQTRDLRRASVKTDSLHPKPVLLCPASHLVRDRHVIKTRCKALRHLKSRLALPRHLIHPPSLHLRTLRRP